MAEPLAVDPSRLSAAGNKLAGLDFPAPPAPFAVAGSDAVSAAINATMPEIESLVGDGLPGVKAALTKTASSMAVAADIYAKTDQSLGEGLERAQGSSQGQVSAASSALALGPAQMLKSAATTTMGVGETVIEQASILAPRLTATASQLIRLAPQAAQMVQQMSPIVQTVSQTAQQATSSSAGAGAPMQLVSDTKLAEEDKEDKEEAQSEAEAVEDNDGALAGNQNLGNVPLAGGSAGGNSSENPLAAPI